MKILSIHLDIYLPHPTKLKVFTTFALAFHSEGQGVIEIINKFPHLILFIKKENKRI